MGMSISCPFARTDDLDAQFESLLVRSLSFGGDDEKSALQSVNLNSQESSPDVMKSFGSGKMTVEGPVSFKRRELKTMSSFKPAYPFMDKSVITQPVNNNHKGGQAPDQSPTIDSMPLSHPHKQRCQAALKLQKTYRSFRTRRQLADCAVIVEQRWWKLLDFVELKHNSISFFDIEKPETAISRWSRAKNRAAKVGKGLSKDEKARKLALQHWLEAIDPRHRYGHNLQFYYAKWLHCESRQPFFYWLDIGEGKEVCLERCHRTKLQQQCIKYLGPTERKAYEVNLEEGKFVYKQSGRLLDTREGPEEAKWIFVLGVCKTLFVGLKQKGTFQHSSFLAGGATLSAGRLEVEDGILKAVWPHSGHYLPTKENFEAFMSFLTENGVDLSNVQKNYKVEEEGAARVEKAISIRLRNSICVPDFIRIPEETKAMSLNEENSVSRKQYCDDRENLHPPSSRWSQELRSKMLKLEISRREDVFKMLAEAGVSCGTQSVDEESEGYETAEEYLSDVEFSVSKQNLFDEGEEEEEHVPKEKIIHRINSHKGMKSYQFAQHLSCRWTTGAGPRIGCVRDYPSELQFRALEEVQLSPRSALARHRSVFSSPEVKTSAKLCRIIGKSPPGMQQAMC